MRNITARQDELLDRLRQLYPAVTIQWDEARGVVASARGSLARASGKNKGEGIVLNFLKEFGELFGPADLHDQSQLLNSRQDDLNWLHLEYQQTTHVIVPRGKKKQLEVYGAKLVAHLTADGILKEVQSSCWRDVEVAAKAHLSAKDVRQRLTGALVNAPGYAEMQLRMRRLKERDFPVMQEPRLVVYPWEGAFRLAWTTYAYGLPKRDERANERAQASRIILGQVFMDAATGERFLFMQMGRYAETPDTGTGLSCTPLDGPFSARPLNIVSVDMPPTFRLKDTTHAREIITYDAGCNFSWTYPTMGHLLSDGVVPVSRDTDGDKNWNRLPADTTDAQRTASQQPEVDAHATCTELYEWFDALAGGRAGWDDDQYTAPLVPNQTIRVAAHAYDDLSGFCRSSNAYMATQLVDGSWVAFLIFHDGDPTLICAGEPLDGAFGYFAGSKFIVAHEYQHAITTFNFRDGVGNPGLPYPSAPDPEWLSAVHEGISDVFGCLFSEIWIPGPEISPSSLVLRNLAYPLDPTAWSNRMGMMIPCGAYGHNKDHFADRNDTNARYDRGTILGHCAFLMGAGGVHQRASRAPALIPVYSMGRQTISGHDFLRAARIWYRAFTYYFHAAGVPMGVPANDENVFRLLRDSCVSAAEDIYGANSREHRTTILAFYAVGLQPTDTPYGADVTFLRWGASWRLSRPYVGLDSPTWSSLDLFINNGGASEWNALINTFDEMDNPTQFENRIYCRVRNVGDEDATDVNIQFFYAKAGAGIFTWLPVEDKDGVEQTLSLGTLAAGQSNFPDSAQDTPPADASVKWFIPPLDEGEVVGHFCLKAVVTASNDVNTFNNQVQSNIAYASYTRMGFTMSFMVGNPTPDEIPVELDLHASLPEKWKASIRGPQRGVVLKSGEQRPFSIVIEMPPGADRLLEPPFDGNVSGSVSGCLSGDFTGTLTETAWAGGRLRGRFAARMEDIGALYGTFDGTLNVSTAEIKGRVQASFKCEGENGAERICVAVRGCLRPWRRVDVSQSVNGVPIGGLTVQVQVPLPAGPCARALPPTATRYDAPKRRRPQASAAQKSAGAAKKTGARKKR